MRKRKKSPYKILTIDPWLLPYQRDIELRMDRYTQIRQLFLGGERSLSQVATGYLYYGFHKGDDGWTFREWAPGADAIHLVGDFNNWNESSHPLTRLERGVWEINLPPDALAHGQRIKIRVSRGGVSGDRIPAYATRVVKQGLNDFAAQIWIPDDPFPWTDGGYGRRKISPPYIYEAHIGMAQEKEGVGTYAEFTKNVLPRIKAGGYNTIQLMGIMEHPYYASFGYQVTNYFAPSSQFGTPEELKELINTAHSMEMLVLMDLVHSHASANVNEGLSRLDGTDDQYFKPGPEGWHPAWGSRLFQYGKHEVIHFLLSNLKYWQDVFHFDGFRFDGVTSMLYHDHGLGEQFDNYSKYFSLNTDVEAVTYLQLANELVHEVNPFALTIAEDMSGMPGMALPVRYGGLGFDYRLAMGVPDFWIKQLKLPDEKWSMGSLWYELTTRRPQESNIGYAESHDQALVGDKTIIFWLADAEMYTGMDKAYRSFGIDRAIALHKMIRFATLTMAGEGYLNFMGNEFGHPEWIDFPREGNDWSYKYARRQWSLADNGYLKYEWLLEFDRDMLRFARKYRVLVKKDIRNLWIDEKRKLLAFSKGGMLYLFNFSPDHSEPEFFLHTHATGAGRYQVVFDSDQPSFGGQGRISHKTVYQSRAVEGKGEGFTIYSPCRTVMVLRKLKEKN